jgi:hypothetical protein
MSATRPVNRADAQYGPSKPQLSRTVDGEQIAIPPRPCSNPLFRRSLDKRGASLTASGLGAGCAEHHSGDHRAGHPSGAGHQILKQCVPYPVGVQIRRGQSAMDILSPCRRGVAGPWRRARLRFHTRLQRDRRDHGSLSQSIALHRPAKCTSTGRHSDLEVRYGLSAGANQIRNLGPTVDRMAAERTPVAIAVLRVDLSLIGAQPVIRDLPWATHGRPFVKAGPRFESASFSGESGELQYCAAGSSRSRCQCAKLS